MTEKEAYGNRDYETREETTYFSGDRVTVGPAYRMGGTYEFDGAEGDYTVVASLGDNDYKVCRGDLFDPSDYEFIIHSSRLTKRK